MPEKIHYNLGEKLELLKDYTCLNTRDSSVIAGMLELLPFARIREIATAITHISKGR